MSATPYMPIHGIRPPTLSHHDAGFLLHVHCDAPLPQHIYLHTFLSNLAARSLPQTSTESWVGSTSLRRKLPQKEDRAERGGSLTWTPSLSPLCREEQKLCCLFLHGAQGLRAALQGLHAVCGVSLRLCSQGLWWDGAWGRVWAPVGARGLGQLLYSATAIINAR